MKEQKCDICGTNMKSDSGTQFNGRTTCYSCNSVIVSKAEDELDNLLIDPNEEIVALIGNDYLINFLLKGSFRKGFAIVTNKRIYFKGKSYDFNGGRIVKASEARIIDIIDITSTGVYTYEPIWLGVLGGISLLIAGITWLNSSNVSFGYSDFTFNFLGTTTLLSLIIAGVTIFQYFAKSIIAFTISYPGGRLLFDISLYSKDQVENFHRSIRQLKDQQKAGNVQDANQTSESE